MHFERVDGGAEQPSSRLEGGSVVDRADAEPGRKSERVPFKRSKLESDRKSNDVAHDIFV